MLLVTTDITTVIVCPKCNVFWPADAIQPECSEPDHRHQRFDVHRHRSPVLLPDRTEVTAVSFYESDPYGRERSPDFGLYLDDRWRPPWCHEHVAWPDFGLPNDPDRFVDALRDVLARARQGQNVEIGCVGGHGRTGTALACLAVLTGYPPTAAVTWVRDHYCSDAVETSAQAAFVGYIEDTPNRARDTCRSGSWPATADARSSRTALICASSSMGLSPATEAESNGLEDARFVRFDELDGTVTYYATYTAYNGSAIVQQLLATTDFVSFTSTPLLGPAAANKGLALFPRRIGERLHAMSRFDGATNAVTCSNDLGVWTDAAPLDVDVSGWDLVQVGHCGSPVELDEGWLVLTHGVGPLRTYSIGALLLDLDDPSVVIGQSRRPLLTPQGDE